jgi:glycosyltransferase involved in cell wall biosynthesis
VKKCFNLYENSILSFLTKKYLVLPNGIDTDYFTNTKENVVKNNLFTFGCIGGRNVQKRIDVLLKAGSILSKQSNKFDIIIIEGTDTRYIVNEFFNQSTPNWLKIVEPSENMIEFYSSLSCFVSTSVHETFSNAIAEASIFGLPVIQSDIEGTMWNSQNPSTFLFESLNHLDLQKQMLNVINLPKEELLLKCNISKENNIRKYNVKTWSKKVMEFYNDCY